MYMPLSCVFKKATAALSYVYVQIHVYTFVCKRCRSLIMLVCPCSGSVSVNVLIKHMCVSFEQVQTRTIRSEKQLILKKDNRSFMSWSVYIHWHIHAMKTARVYEFEIISPQKGAVFEGCNLFTDSKA